MHTGDGRESDMDDATIEEFHSGCDEGGAPARTAPNCAFAPVSAMRASRAFETPSLDLLEDTVPLASYRPERLIG